ncbi:MAG: hypothetical protein KAG43_05535 [Candidatus Marithrix sp.]|nr:hypothetical protein [Candidatus Marithrix sp.]
MIISNFFIGLISLVLMGIIPILTLLGLILVSVPILTFIAFVYKSIKMAFHHGIHLPHIH